MASPPDPRGAQNPPVPARASSTPAASEPPLSRPLLRFLWPLVCLFQVGIILGWVFVYLRSGPASEEPAQIQEPLAKAKRGGEAEGAPTGPVTLGRGDDWLREGRYDLALALFRRLRSQPAMPLEAQLDYRLGLCLEGLGQWEEASAIYRSVADKVTQVPLVASAQLGQSRISIQLGRNAEARKLLYALLRNPVQPGVREPPYLADARYYLGLAWMADAVLHETPSPLNDAVLPAARIDWHLDQALDWAALKQPAAELGKPVAELFAVGKVGNSPEEYLVRAALPPASIAGLVERLTPHCGLQAQWTAQAQQRADKRQTPLVVENMAVGDLLTALLDPLGVVWHVDKGALQLLGEQEAARELLQKYRSRTGWRTLREALLAYPGHPLAPLAQLEMGNLEASLGKLAEARQWYERVVKAGPRSPVLHQAAYNLGLILWRSREPAAARAAFYQVVDQAPGSELAALAYLRIGRTYLEEGKPEQALPPLRRALELSLGSATQPAAAVTLAAAQLLAGQPQAAHAALLAARNLVNQPPYRATAALLDALARFRTAADRVQAQREGNDLHAALANLTREVVLGSAGKLLIAHAYRELGLDKSMLVLLEQTLPATQGPMAEEMSYLLAEALLPTPRRQEALKLFDALATYPGSKWAQPAKFHLAEIALQEDRPQECLTWCRALWRAPGTVSRAGILRLMGRAFERLGNTRQAALCFAGEAPEEGSIPNSPPAKEQK